MSPPALVTSLLGLAWCAAPEAELLVCRDELFDLADRLRLAVDHDPSWRALFVLDSGLYVPDALEELGGALEGRVAACPCLGPCTSVEQCAAAE